MDRVWELSSDTCFHRGHSATSPQKSAPTSQDQISLDLFEIPDFRIISDENLLFIEYVLGAFMPWTVMVMLLFVASIK